MKFWSSLSSGAKRIVIGLLLVSFVCAGMFAIRQAEHNRIRADLRRWQPYVPHPDTATSNTWGRQRQPEQTQSQTQPEQTQPQPQP